VSLILDGAFMPPKNGRYRIYINALGKMMYCRDTLDEIRNIMRYSAVLISIHSLIFQQDKLIRICGDIHLRWSLYSGFEYYTDFKGEFRHTTLKPFEKTRLALFFRQMAIPVEYPRYYCDDNHLVHVFIPEKAFSTPCNTTTRLEVDFSIFRFLRCYQLDITFYDHEGERLPFYPCQQALMSTPELPSKFFWQTTDIFNEEPPENVSAIPMNYDRSLLCEHYWPDNKKRLDLLNLCPVLYNGGRQIAELSSAEIELLLSILCKKKYIQWLVRNFSTSNAPEGVLYDLFEKAIGQKKTWNPPFCIEINKWLRSRNSRLQCSGNCGVTTPLALMFKEPFFREEFRKKYSPTNDTLFQVASDGVYKTTSSGKKRELILSRPLWISYGIKGGLGQGNGFQLAFYNAMGSYCEVTIANDSILGPALFNVLEQHGLEIPKSPKCRSMLREYLKTIRVKLLCDATMVSSCGWQQVPSGITVFVLPSTSYSSRSPDFRYIAPTKCLPEFGTHAPNTAKTTYSPRVRITASSMLAKTASFAAPLLRILKLRGFCLYFYSDNANERQNILKAAAAVWEKSYGSVTYTLPISAKNIPELKRIHRDSAICLDLPDSEHEGNFLAFVRRFLHGRKGKDGKECGVIIAVGKRPLKSASDTVGRCQIVSSQSGKRGPRDVLVLSMPYNDNDPDLTLSQVQTHGESLLRALVSFSKDDENTLRNRFKKIQDECRPKGCSNNVKKAVAIFSLSLHSLQRYPQLFVSKILGNNTGMADKVMNLLLSDMLDPHEHFKKYLHNLHARQSTAYLLPSKKHLFLYPTKLFHNCCDTAHQKAFVHFLLTWNILVCKKRGQTSSVVHISEKAKSVRGYLISIQKLEEQLLKIDPQSYRQQYIDRLQRAKVARVKQKEDNTADKRK
jgi:hypothetical protein